MPTPDEILLDFGVPNGEGPSPLEILRDELMALEARELLPINVDLASAACIVIGAASEIREHRAALGTLVGEEMARPVDRLELLARAVLQAHARHRAIETGADIAPLVARVNEHREMLRAEVRLLIGRKLLPQGSLDQLTHGQGYKNISFDVLQLVAILRQAWEHVHDRTGLRVEELDRAESVANALLTSVGLREQGARAPSADTRQRAFTLLARTYDHARRLMWFLRWRFGDADRIAPSLFLNRGRRRGRVAAVAQTPVPLGEAGAGDESDDVHATGPGTAR